MTHRPCIKTMRLTGAAFCLAAVASLGTFTSAFGGSGSSSVSAGGDEAAADGGGIQLLSEAIGSLPGFWVEDTVLNVAVPAPLDGNLQDSQHLEVFVPDEALYDLFSEATGDGYALLSYPADMAGWTRVRIFGSVDVDLDRVQVHMHQVAVSVMYGHENADAAASILWQGVILDQYGVHSKPDHLALPVLNKAFLSSVAADPAKLLLLSPSAGLSKTELSAGNGQISLGLEIL